jgi:hypothetical protein
MICSKSTRPRCAEPRSRRVSRVSCGRTIGAEIDGRIGLRHQCAWFITTVGIVSVPSWLALPNGFCQLAREALRDKRG